jgi:hypothetical protein
MAGSTRLSGLTRHPLFHEEVVLCGAEGRLMASERWDFLPQSRPRMHLEILRGDAGPSRISHPCYPVFVEESGHNVLLFYSLWSDALATRSYSYGKRRSP